MTVSPAPSTTRDRDHLRVLGGHECRRRLASVPIGRLAFVADGDLHVLPVRHTMVGGLIVFRSASGTKFDAALRTATCAFEVDGYEPVTRTGWSVVAKGIADVIDDEDQIAQLEKLDLPSWLPGNRPRYWVQLRIDEITGRSLDLRTAHEADPTTAWINPFSRRGREE